MTLLDEAIKINKTDGRDSFITWYSSLSEEEKERLNTELRESAEKITQAFTEFSNYMQDTMPVIFANFSKVLIDFSKQMRDNE